MSQLEHGDMKNLFRLLLGDRGERAAVKYLKKQGFRIIAKQYRNSYGEVDIIGQDGKTTVFVEVKTRTSTKDGQPFEAVDLRKQQKITRMRWRGSRSTVASNNPPGLTSFLFFGLTSGARHRSSIFEMRLKPLAMASFLADRESSRRS